MFVDEYNNKHIYGVNLVKNNEVKFEDIIDIREPFELDICKVPNTKCIPMMTLLNGYKQLLNKDATYYILCHTGQRSYLVTDKLTELGYNVINIIGGIASIEEYNVPY